MADMHKWERVDLDRSVATHRMRVPGGWLYRVTTFAGYGDDDVSTVTYVPEPAEDEWEGMRAKDIRKARNDLT